jgi:hypothetical protein
VGICCWPDRGQILKKKKKSQLKKRKWLAPRSNQSDIFTICFLWL